MGTNSKIEGQIPVVRVMRDDSIPAYGAWCAGSMADGQPLILLNVEACFSNGVDDDGEVVELSAEERKWVAITTLMHEFGHAMQEFFELEFEEDRLEEIIAEFS